MKTPRRLARRSRSARRRGRWFFFLGGGGGGDGRQDVHEAAGAARELHMTVDQREQRVVLAESDVLTGEELRAALTHQDVSGTHALTAETLHAEALGVRL